MDYIINLNWCAQLHADLYHGGNPESRRKLFYGFEVLDELTSIWYFAMYNSTSEMCTALAQHIRTTSASGHEAIKFLFQTITGAHPASWVQREEKTVRTGPFKVFAMLWTIALGSGALKHGWRVGRQLSAMLREHEDDVDFSKADSV